MPLNKRNETILLAIGLPKETVTAIMMLYKNMKAMVSALDGETDFFDVVAEVLQGDKLSPSMVIICLDFNKRLQIQ